MTRSSIPSLSYAQDTIGLIEASNSISFTVEDTSAYITPEHPDNDKSTMSTEEPFTTELAITASGASVAVIGVGLYFKKRKH